METVRLVDRCPDWYRLLSGGSKRKFIDVRSGVYVLATSCRAQIVNFDGFLRRNRCAYIGTNFLIEINFSMGLNQHRNVEVVASMFMLGSVFLTIDTISDERFQLVGTDVSRHYFQGFGLAWNRWPLLGSAVRLCGTGWRSLIQTLIPSPLVHIFGSVRGLMIDVVIVQEIFRATGTSSSVRLPAAVTPWTFGRGVGLRHDDIN